MSLLPTPPDSRTPAAISYIKQLQQALVVLHREILKARKAMEVSANRRRRAAPTLLQGQKVWLLRRNISTTRPSSKLDVRRLGPFAIIGQVDTSSFRLDLPPSMHIHPVFHVSLLEPHVANTFPGRVEKIPPPLVRTTLVRVPNQIVFLVRVSLTPVISIFPVRVHSKF